MSKNLLFLSGPFALAALSLILLATGIYASDTTSRPDEQLAAKKSPRSSFVLPQSMNFNAFKQRFEKHYKSLAEEMNRKLYFIERAASAVVSALRYKLGLDSSYKRVNELSDYTNAELDQMENKVLKESAEDEVLEHGDEVHSDRGAEGEAKSAKLRSEKEFKEDGALIEDLSHEGLRSRRRRRDTSAPLEWHKMKSYQEMGWANMVANPRFFYESQLNDQDRAQLPDELFVDFRRTNCFAAVRHQGRCGCCYAFASLSILEYQICRRSREGRIMSLSPQYMVDCGNGRYNNRLRGCEGGYVKEVARFVHDFGLHLLRDYEYAGELQQCPYDLDSNPKAAGYLRMNLGHAVSFHQDHWERILEDGGPLMVHVAAYRGMSQYGGGIDYAWNCPERPNHEMVLIGHGRENGQHYWLIRNTYGETWGEQGYWRMAKASTDRCMSKYAQAFGTQDGLLYSARAKVNTHFG